jgi:alpha-mannosidase
LESDVVRLGYALNMPLRFGRETCLTAPIAHADKENILLETVCRERSGDTVLRFYETAGKLTQTAIRVRPQYEAVRETDMLTENGCPVDLTALTFKPYEIKTLVLTGAKE